MFHIFILLFGVRKLKIMASESSSSSTSGGNLHVVDGDREKRRDDQDAAFLVSSEDPIWQPVTLGVITGTTCILVGYPLDTIKVRLQSGGLRTNISQLFKTPGLYTNLYRGVTAPLSAVVPSWAATFFLYGMTLKVCCSHFDCMHHEVQFRSRKRS